MSDGLRILVTADPELPVPPPLYGGIERIIGHLVEGLVERGHEVTLAAHRDSSAPCTLVPYRGLRSTSIADTVVIAAQIARAVARRRPDVVQSFGRLAYLAPVLPWPVPKVMSYQRAITPRSIRWSRRLARGPLAFTGCSHRLIRDVAGIGTWHVIYNAVPVDRIAATRVVAADAPLVFLGRVEHIKGAHVAIDVARRSGRRLVIAGNVPDGHQSYFDEHIAPALDGRAVTYAGPVDDRAKNELLARAAALLMPVLWDEPFGIVMAEALACGTPVVGLDRGAVGEVVEDGQTGFVCRHADQMVEAVGRLGTIDRTACRRSAERRFSVRGLVDAYETLYGELVPRRRAETVAFRSVGGAVRPK